MKKVKKMAAQGDVMFIKIDNIPSDAIEAKAEKGYLIVAHSETGHNHVIDCRNAQMLIDKTNNFIAYLKVSKPAEVEHKRSFDTHESLLLDPGNYEVRRQREYVAEGFRRVAD
jgi:hypothetical protein